MFKGLSVLGFIPARAGSKGLPGKNIRLLDRKPLIVYTIEASRQSDVFDYLMVSTDGEDIAGIAQQAGADVPFMRPASLATDTARGIDVLHHSMSLLSEQGKKYDCVMILQPTSPLRNAEDIIAALDLFVERNTDAVVSVCEVENHPWWSSILPEDLCMKDFLGAGIPANRQELPKYYRLNGAIYLARWDFIRERENWFGPGTFAYIMPRQRSLDIDDEVDLLLAEIIAKVNR
ncbi:MAG: acylneuraminate cytidylyltransferase family protein [Bacillota bacterium]